jgi:enoyl-CoA hydratase/carnithine racemase
MSDAVLYEREGGIVTLTLNRPEKRNPISERDVVDGLVAALGRVQADASARVVILTGAGTAFSSGGDLRAMEARSMSAPKTRARPSPTTRRESSASRSPSKRWTRP